MCMTLANAVGETMQHLINHAEDEFNTDTSDIVYARASLKMLDLARAEITKAIADSGQDKRYKS